MATKTTESETSGLNLAVLIGEVTTPVVTRDLPNGDIASTFDITSLTRDGRLSVPVSLNDSGENVSVGAVVLVVGVVRRRFFRSGGSVASRTEVVAHHVVPVRRRAMVRRALQGVVSNIDDLIGG